MSRVICKAQWMLDVLQTFKRGLYIVFPCMFALVSINPPIFYFPGKIGSGSFFFKSKNFFKCLSLDAGSYFLVHFAGERKKNIQMTPLHGINFKKLFVNFFLLSHTKSTGILFELKLDCISCE